MASDSVSPAIVVNLFFRVLIFYSATKIIPALQGKGDRQLNKSRRIMNVLYWYSPCILIAMYTHLILQYSGELNRDLCLWGCNPSWFSLNQTKIIVDSWGFWNWCNIFWTILVYGIELISGKKWIDRLKERGGSNIPIYRLSPPYRFKFDRLHSTFEPLGLYYYVCLYIITVFLFSTLVIKYKDSTRSTIGSTTSPMQWNVIISDLN